MIPDRTPSSDEAESERAAAPLPGAPGMEPTERKEAIAEEPASDASRLFVPPAEGASGKGVPLPPKLLSFALDVGAEAYGRLGNFEAAMNIAKRRVKERWSAEKGASGYVFNERTHPLDDVLQEWKLGSQGSVHAHSGGKVATTRDQGSSESEDVAEARKRWDAAKASGDPDAMTRAANDLLRVVEAEQAAQGKSSPAQADGGRHPTSEVLAPEKTAHESGRLAEAAAQADHTGKTPDALWEHEAQGIALDGSVAPTGDAPAVPSNLVPALNGSGDEGADGPARHLAPYVSHSLLADAAGRGALFAEYDLTHASDEAEIDRGASASIAQQPSEVSQANSFEATRGRDEPLSERRGRWREDQIQEASKRFFRDEDIVQQRKMKGAFEQFREEAAQRGIDEQTAFLVFRYLADTVRSIAVQVMRDSGLSPEDALQRAIDLVLITDPRLRKNGWWRDGDTLEELGRNGGYFRQGLPPEMSDRRPRWKAYEPLARERRRDALVDFFTWLTGDRDLGRFYGGRLDEVVGLVDRGTSLRELYERRIERKLPWNWWEDPFLILDVGGGTVAKKGGEEVLRRVLGAPPPPDRWSVILSVFNPKHDSAKRWREHAPPVEPVTGGVTGNGSPVITVTRTKRNLWGFTPESFEAVRARFVGQVRAAGYTDARVGIVGSAATGRSHKGPPFRPDSDLDLAIVSKTILSMIRSRRELAEIGVHRLGKSSEEFYEEKYHRALGLDGLVDEIKRLTGRNKVTIRVYESEEAMGAEKAKQFFDFSLGWEGM